MNLIQKTKKIGDIIIYGRKVHNYPQSILEEMKYQTQQQKQNFININIAYLRNRKDYIKNPFNSPKKEENNVSFNLGTKAYYYL